MRFAIIAAVFLFLSAIFAPAALAYTPPKPAVGESWCDDSYTENPCFTVRKTDRYASMQFTRTMVQNLTTGSLGWSYSDIKDPWCSEIVKHPWEATKDYACWKREVNATTHIFYRWRYPIPKSYQDRIKPHTYSGYTVYWTSLGEGYRDSRVANWAYNTPPDTPPTVSDYCRLFQWIDPQTGYHARYIGVDETPDALMRDCNYQIRASEFVRGEHDHLLTGLRNHECDCPGGASSCGSHDGLSICRLEDGKWVTYTEEQWVRMNSAWCGTVSVRASRTIRTARAFSNCGVAERVLRSYLTSMRSPARWNCTWMRGHGRNRIAKCTYAPAGKPTRVVATARWVIGV